MPSQEPIEVFDELVQAGPPDRTSPLLDTACVLGGSIAGLLAARVLSDHARKVLIIESDEVNVLGRPRAGVPQDCQGHGLLPGGAAQIERLLPGITTGAQDLGAVLADPDHSALYLDGHRQARGSDASILMASRPFLESRIRERVVTLPNVSTLSARASGIEYADDAVSAVRCVAGGSEVTIAVDFIVDAMGQASTLSDWVQRDGYDRPKLELVRTDINYATAHFERTGSADEQDLACAMAQFGSGSSPDGLAVGTVNAIEADQWLVMLMAYGENRAAESMEAFRSACANMPPIFGKAVSGSVTRDIITHHQEDSRRRRFTELSRFPARLISVGDAVESFDPLYGQGITSAARQVSCLSEYLTGEPDLTTPATDFFALQETVVDAAWTRTLPADQDQFATL